MLRWWIGADHTTLHSNVSVFERFGDDGWELLGGHMGAHTNGTKMRKRWCVHELALVLINGQTDRRRMCDVGLTIITYTNRSRFAPKSKVNHHARRAHFIVSSCRVRECVLEVGTLKLR